jgi:alkylated DNA nucleotide flippase Atl1
VPLVIPCHRVVRSDGDLGQYGMGGPAAKRTVLAAEGVDAKELEELARAGIRYIVHDHAALSGIVRCGSWEQPT